MSPSHSIILFYAFVPIEDPELLKNEQKTLCSALGLKGRLLIATEGINGTFEGTKDAIESYKTALKKDPRFAHINFKESQGNGVAFKKLEVRVRQEVVTLGAGAFNIKEETAQEVSAQELHQMYEAGEDFVILDLRNDYEIESGKFTNTEHPHLQNFRELPQKLASIAHLKKKKVVAVCTGGIRCEKATCLLQREGFENVYQLKDGIHTYMQEYPGQNFKGTLFVFDNRMVTPVIEGASREVIGVCAFCRTSTEDYYSDDSVRPSKKIICCESCIRAHNELRSCATV